MAEGLKTFYEKENTGILKLTTVIRSVIVNRADKAFCFLCELRLN